MINCFPRMYELYSVVSRYKRNCGIVLQKSIMEDFYDRNVGMFSILFPMHLEFMSNMLPISSNITCEELIVNHTMYPYYTKFLSSYITKDIFESMIKGDNTSITVKARLHNGEMISNRYLKYCPFCVEEDIEKLGESYWRREHQVIGVWFCAKHKTQLYQSDVVMTKINNRYVCLDDIEISNKKNIDEGFLEYNLKYVELVKELGLNNSKRIELCQVNKFYKHKLNLLGLLTPGGEVKTKEFTTRVLEYYPKGYLKLMQCDIDNINSQTNWVSKFFSVKHNKSTLKHLMLLQCLESTIDEMFKFKESISFDKKIYYISKERKLDLDDRKNEWLEVLQENPNKSRTELLEIAPAIRNYVYKYDRAWFEKVTPKNNKKNGKQVFDWKARDEEMYGKVTIAAKNILCKNGKPIRICTLSIKKELTDECNCSNPKLVKTAQLIKELTESKERFRERKITWAIKELLNSGEKLSINKVKIKSGLGNSKTDSVKEVIEKIIIGEFS